MNAAAEIIELRESVAFLAELIEESRIEQTRQNKSVEETLKTWDKVNLKLTETITRQAEDSSGFSGQQQRLTECLINLTQYSGILGQSTNELSSSLENLRRYLEEEQSPQVLQLAENTAILKTSSASLSQFVTGEQAQRSKNLEEGMRSLILIMEQIPGIESVTTLPSQKEKKPSFDRTAFISGILYTSLCTTVLLSMVLYLSGIGKSIIRAEERTIWSIMKLEKIESFFGIE